MSKASQKTIDIKVASANAGNPRWIALQVMLQVSEQGRSLDDVFKSDWFLSLPAEKRDLALCREIVFGLCRWYFALSALLTQRLQKPLRARDHDIEIVLLIGFYQILIMQTGAHAAVNETVKLALAQKKKWASGLVNAVLRTVLRENLSLDANADTQAYPPWMQEKVKADWEGQSEAILRAGNQRPPMTLRVDTRQIDVEMQLSELAASGIEARGHIDVDGAIVLDSACDVTELPGFDEGKISVQDAAAQLAAQLLDCEPGARVLDACAAPGGKAIHLLQRYPGIELDALDSSVSRLDRLRQNLQRSGQSARILVGDAAVTDAWYDGHQYDAILADVPCSASGVLRRHPDIKLLRRESDIIPLRAQQAKILDALWLVLKPGGKMLYSTCSIFKDENEVQVAEFLQRHPDALEISLQEANWGEPRPHGRQILPGNNNMDGFYYSLLARIAES
ncbi:16S rRNA (cytosine(967)-C(5))-methyltransferase RsmB [Gammaproteobacteria bacterium]|nr:16S rRNA (cytosine(967)-C(5))-methyltransferase RsmB [Gammaproteobacteria bacterium]